MTSLPEVARKVGVGEMSIVDVVAMMASYSSQLDGMDIEDLVFTAKAAKAQGDAVGAYKSFVDEAEQSQRLLDRLHALASYKLGRIMAELDAGGRGKSKSERTRIAEGVGLDRHQARALAEFASRVSSEEELDRVVEALEEKGSRPTPRSMLKAVMSTSAAEGYDGDEWYTPPAILDAARSVFGGVIDLDPASCIVAQQHVRARAWYSKSGQSYDERAKAAGITEAQAAKLLAAWRGAGDVKDGRLTQPLAGKVWCNPPYSIPHPFLASIVEAYNDGRGQVSEAILLVNVATDTAIQQRMLAASSARCWISGRLAFLDPVGTPIKGNRYSQVIYYLGSRPSTFVAAFADFGECKADRSAA